jgi:4a-hydroxytetrahydrobiopterin dehydratase
MSDATRDPKQTLTFEQLEQESGLEDWRYVYGRLRARFATGDFATGLGLVDRIGAAAEEADHHPDVTLTYPHVDVVLVSHDVGGVTSRDLALARTVSGLAAEAGAQARPHEVAVVELALDVPDETEVRDFWAAVLGYDVDGDEVQDPAAALPGLWFQRAPGATGPVDQQRFHVDIGVPLEIAEERVAAAVAAGGTLVTAEHAPAFWVLADVHGNQVCVCTSAGRTSSEAATD